MCGKENEVLKVADIFRSIQGEATFMGFPSVFIRLHGCNLNCAYCDTPLSEFSFEEMTLQKLVREVESFHLKHVCITGGEPLLQEHTTDLCYALQNKGFHVSVETNGTIPLLHSDHRSKNKKGGTFNYSMDFKLPSAGEKEFELAKKMLMKNLPLLGKGDCIKFVCGLKDMVALNDTIIGINRFWRDKIGILDWEDILPEIFVSPIMDADESLNTIFLQSLVGFVIGLEKDFGIQVRLQIQLHKIIGVK